MNKELLKKISSFIRLGVCALLIGILLMPLATGLKMVIKSSGGDVITTYKSAYTLIFGGSLISEHITYTVEKASALGVIAFVILILSLAACVTSIVLIKKNSKVSTLSLVGGLALLLTGSIMMLSMHRACASQLADTITGGASDSVKNTIYGNTHLQFGFIGPGIFGLVGSFALIVSLFFDGTIDELRSRLFNK